MPMKTRLMREGVSTPRPLPMRTRWRLSTAATCPAISPAVRFRRIPSFAVRQNWQFTAQPTWLEMQMVARL